MSEKKLTLPRMGETMNEGTIVAWLKQPGEHFRRGETLLEVESDKTNVEIPALEDGEMVLHLALAGEKVAVDYPIAVVQTFELSASSSKAAEAQPTLKTQVAPEPEIPSSEDLPLPVAGAKIRASPAARRTAREMGVNLPEIKGTGPRGRVTGTDVRRHATLSVKPPRSIVAESSGQPLRWGTPQRGRCILLHGFAGDPTTWRRTGEFLAEQGFEAIAFELPGHGSPPMMGPSLDELAAEVISRLPSPPNGKFHLIGHSLGGAFAILIAARDPGRVASLTLLAPIGIGTYINQSFLDGIVSARTIETLERELRKTTGRPLSYATSALAAMLESRRADELKAIGQMMALDGVQQLFLVPELEKITVPARVFFGRQDKILNWQDALSLPGRIALHLFDTGHMPHWEDPTAVLPVLAGFPVCS
ncbi:MAG: alpha/beta fold hydrolase [Verrucomicrobia bacterium]|nr:alpha/beta fold hydrolase [Verrucomicrobiota bacterium]